MKTLHENGINEFNAVTGGPEVYSGRKFQVIVANLTSPVIIGLQQVLGSLTAEYLVISGFTEQQKYITLEKFLDSGFVLEEIHPDKGWISCRLKKVL